MNEALHIFGWIEQQQWLNIGGLWWFMYPPHRCDTTSAADVGIGKYDWHHKNMT